MPDRLDELLDTACAAVRDEEGGEQPGLLGASGSRRVADDLDRPRTRTSATGMHRILARRGVREDRGYTEAKSRSPTLYGMSYAFVEDVAASWESYERFAVELERSLPEGLILHAAGTTDEGVRIIEVWESEEAWSAFAEAIDPPDGDRFSAAPRYLRRR